MISSCSSATRPATRLLVILTIILGMMGGVATTTAAPAQAAGVSAITASRALSYAAGRQGALYLFGAAGPTRFDCSGLTMWAYARAGRRIPRTVAQQYAATIRVSRASARPGDLVFFMSGGRPYHMGIRASAGRVWHSPKAGSRVKLSIVWTTAVAYGRVR